jgi:hypothetical protein
MTEPYSPSVVMTELCPLGAAIINLCPISIAMIEPCS